MSPTTLSLLRAVIDRIIPSDDRDPGALALGSDRYVEHILQTAAASKAPAILAGLQHLASETAFLAAAPADRDKLLESVENEPWFRALVDLTAEGFYANPANGGNAGARSWQMIGYEHRLPEGPDGPPPSAMSPQEAR